jgi:hypothetical protein
MTTTTKPPAAERDERLLRLLDELGDRELTAEENQRILDVAGFDVGALAAKIQAEAAKIEAQLAANEAANRADAGQAAAKLDAAAPPKATPANDTRPVPDKKNEARRTRLFWAIAAAVLGVAALAAAGGGVIVAFDLWPQQVRYGGAPHVKLPAEPVPSESAPTGPPTPPPRRVPKR